MGISNGRTLDGPSYDMLGIAFGGYAPASSKPGGDIRVFCQQVRHRRIEGCCGNCLDRGPISVLDHLIHHSSHRTEGSLLCHITRYDVVYVNCPDRPF